MERALVVSGTEKGRELFTELLQACGCTSIDYAQDGRQARALLAERGCEMVVINAPLADEFGHDLAVFASGGMTTAAVLAVKADMADSMAEKVSHFGVLVLPKTLSRPLFRYAMGLAAAARSRMLGLQSENVKLRQTIDDIKLIDRAKCVLIEYLRISESQAHRYIEKQAMDLRLSRREVAEGILKTYEN